MADLKVPNINSVILSGRLTQDPELRYTPSGRAVAKLRLAVSRSYKSQSGEWVEDTLYIDVSAWGDLGERCSQRLYKGSPAVVEGRLRSRSWETEAGQKRTAIEVVAMRVQFLEKFGAREEGASTTTPAPAPDEGSPDDEDLPF
jgi:single-strand DNA-binding protein